MTKPTKSWPDGSQIWENEDGQYHREDGPALMWSVGSRYWYRNGMRHREDGPASISTIGEYGWYLDNELYSLNEYVAKIFGDTPEATAFLLKWSK